MRSSAIRSNRARPLPSTSTVSPGARFAVLPYLSFLLAAAAPKLAGARRRRNGVSPASSICIDEFRFATDVSVRGRFVLSLFVVAVVEVAQKEKKKEGVTQEGSCFFAFFFVPRAT